MMGTAAEQLAAAHKAAAREYGDWLAAVLARTSRQSTPANTPAERSLTRVARSFGNRREDPNVRRRLAETLRGRRTVAGALATMTPERLIAARPVGWAQQDPTASAAATVVDLIGTIGAASRGSANTVNQIWVHQRFSVDFVGGKVIDPDDIFNMDTPRFAVTAAYLPADKADKIINGTVEWSDFVIDIRVFDAAPDATGHFSVDKVLVDNVATIHGIACWSVSIVVIDQDSGDLASTLEDLETAVSIASAIGNTAGALAPALSSYPPLAAVAEGVSIVADIVSAVVGAFGGVLELVGNPDDVLGVIGLTAKDIYRYNGKPPDTILRRESIEAFAVGAHYRLDIDVSASDPGQIDDVGSLSLLPSSSVTIPLAWGGGVNGLFPDFENGTGRRTFYRWFEGDYQSASADTTAIKGTISVATSPLHARLTAGETFEIAVSTSGPSGKVPLVFTAPGDGSLVVVDIIYWYAGAGAIANGVPVFGPGMAVGSLTISVE
jgi:hypothetical protein